MEMSEAFSQLSLPRHDLDEGIESLVVKGLLNLEETFLVYIP